MPAGTKINPLDMTGLTKTLVFFDGRDPEQREAVGALLVAKGGQLKVKPILVAGSWLDLTKAWKTQVFYDQKGTLFQTVRHHHGRAGCDSSAGKDACAR